MCLTCTTLQSIPSDMFIFQRFIERINFLCIKYSIKNFFENTPTLLYLYPSFFVVPLLYTSNQRAFCLIHTACDFILYFKKCLYILYVVGFCLYLYRLRLIREVCLNFVREYVQKLSFMLKSQKRQKKINSLLIQLKSIHRKQNTHNVIKMPT